MSEHVMTRWDKVEVLRAARRRRALAELDYRRAVIDVVESGLEVTEVAQCLRVSEATLEGVWNLCEGITEAADGFSGSSPWEIVQRYEVGMLSAEQVVAELTAWDYDGMREAQMYPPPGGDATDDTADDGGDPGHGDDVGEELDAPVVATAGPAADDAGSVRLHDSQWAMWLSEGALRQLQPQPKLDQNDQNDQNDRNDRDEQGEPVHRWVRDPDGMSVNPDGQWAQVEDAFQAGLLPQELYGQVLAAVNPGMYAGPVAGAGDGAHPGADAAKDAGR